MKIVFLIRSLEQGGAETQLVVLANGLVRLGHEVTIVLFYPGGILEDRLEGVHLVKIPKKGRWDVAFLPRFIRAVRELSPDVVHGYLGLGNMLASVCKPFVDSAIVWGVRASNMDLSHYDTGARVSMFLEQVLSRAADGVIVNSHAGMEFAVGQGYDREAMSVIPNGIDVARYSFSDKGRQLFRKEVGVQEGAFLFGLVGRIDPMKGHDVFVDAAIKVVSELPDAHFVCVGKPLGEYAEKVKESVESEAAISGHFHWMDGRQDVYNVYSGLDVLIMASRFGEGFPNVVGEAMACRTPCVVTDVGDAAYLVGDSGVVVPPGDAELLADAMLDMVGRMKQGLSSAGLRARIVENYSIEALLDTTQERLLHIVSKRK